MTTLHVLHSVSDLVLLAVQKGPDPEDVKAGWLGFGVWLALVAAVVLLCFSFVKQLKKVNFKEQDDEPADESAAPSDEQANGSATPS